MKTHHELQTDLMRSARVTQTDNWDPWFGPEPPTGAAQVTLRGRWSAYYLARWSEIEAAAALLADDTSQDLLYRLILYRILGHGHIRLPLNTPAYWELRRTLETHVEARPVGDTWHLHLDRLQHDGLDYLSYKGAMLALHFLHQYAFERDGVRIAPEPGEVVLDAGAFVGDTTLVFSQAVGPDGRVYAFEFVPTNVALFNANMATNPTLANRVTLILHALANQSGDTVSFADRGPASTLVREPADASGHVQTLSIDDFVARQGLDRVDFIKMDVEGAEPNVLLGAAETIRRFRPKLAISAYHQPADLFELPVLIRKLLPDYRLFLDHHTLMVHETVLYAVPESGLA